MVTQGELGFSLRCVRLESMLPTLHLTPTPEYCLSHCYNRDYWCMKVMALAKSTC